MKQGKSVIYHPKKVPFLCTIILLFTFTCAQNETDIDKAFSTYLVNYCSDYSHSNEGSEFQTNLNSLTSNLISKANSTKFHNITAGAINSTNTVYGLFLCNDFASNQVCQDCVTTAVAGIHQNCSFSKVYIGWYIGCMVRYSYQPIFSIKDTSLYFNLMYIPADFSQFQQVFYKTYVELFSNFTTTDLMLSPSSLSTVDIAENISLICYADCTLDLTPANCRSCLNTALNRVSVLGSKVGYLLQPNCRLIYIFNDTRPSIDKNSTMKASCKEQNIGLGVISALAAVFVVFYIGSYFKRRKRTIKSTELDNIESKENLNFDINAIKAATNNFSPSNELGRGGFGVVYKGTLSDEQLVAVKRLSSVSRQGIREFKTEACLAAKLQHKNLVKVYGFCLEEAEMVLVYEYVPNKSLDRFLFDVKQQCLSWETRNKIIVGIARGLSYLHEDSNPKIIHRDLKPSNILLDEAMNPKIADFGMAKMFGGDQTHGDTSRVAGTFGYMAPEYVATGHFSNKSDIFSYGVILLEIISGKRNHFSEIDSPDENLLNYAWRLWNEGSQLMLVDTAIKTDITKNEVERCIQVGLMCIQEDPTKRPSIDSVLFMLHTRPHSLMPPASPPTFPYKRYKQAVSHTKSQSLANYTFSDFSAR